MFRQGQTCRDLCPSGSCATLPPVAAPRPLFLCRPGVCSLEKRKTSTRPARTRRPTPTPFPGSIAPTSSRFFLVFCRPAQNNRRVRVERGAAKRILVSLLLLGTIAQGVHGAPQVGPSLWRAHPSGNPVCCQRAYDGAARIWLWCCGAVRVELCRNPPLSPRSITAGCGFEVSCEPTLAPASGRDPAWRPPAPRVRLRVLLQVCGCR